MPGSAWRSRGMPRVDGAVAPDDGDGLADLLTFSVGQVIEPVLDPGDELPDPGDFLLGRDGFGACPLVDLGRGEHAFAVAEQVVEVGVQVGQVGDVGAEVAAAGAAEPVGAGIPAGLHVGRLGAGAERNRDLADRAAGVLGVQQRLGFPPDAVAVPVELQRGDLVDGIAATAVPDGVVAAGGIEAAMVHQRGEHVDRDPGVGVPLGVGVPVGVRDHARLVEFGAVGAQQRRQAGDPGRGAGRRSDLRRPAGGRAGWRMRQGSSFSSLSAVPGNVSRTRAF